MPRPSTPETRYFQRTLTAPEKMILLAAGEGNLIKGFANVLMVYATLALILRILTKR